jgi:hypothetical protein
MPNAERTDQQTNNSDDDGYRERCAVGHVSLGYDTWRREHFFPSHNLNARPAALIDFPTVEIRIAKRGEECFEERVYAHIPTYEIRKNPEEKCELIHRAKLPDVRASSQVLSKSRLTLKPDKWSTGTGPVL